MSKFKLEKTFKLDFLGDGWKGSYIKFKALTVKDFKKVLDSVPLDIEELEQDEVLGAVDNAIKLLKDNFIEGKGLGADGKKIDISKNDLEDLPPDVITKALSFLSAGSVTPEFQQ